MTINVLCLFLMVPWVGLQCVIIAFIGNTHSSVISFFQESIAIARLKRDLLQVTGNIHFYKVGSAYVVFEVDKDKQSIPNIDGKDTPIPESSA